MKALVFIPPAWSPCWCDGRGEGRAGPGRRSVQAHPLAVARHHDTPVELVLYPASERLAGVRLAMDDVRRARRTWSPAQPRDDLVGIGVDREVRDLHDVGPHRNVAAVHLDGACTVRELSTAGPGGLEPREHDRVPRVR